MNMPRQLKRTILLKIRQTLEELVVEKQKRLDARQILLKRRKELALKSVLRKMF